MLSASRSVLPQHVPLPDDGNVRGPQAFRVFRHFEGHDLPFFQRTIPFGIDRGKMNENVPLTVIPLDKSVALLRIEPFDSTLQRDSPRRP